jgi:hypothetical protein
VVVFKSTKSTYSTNSNSRTAREWVPIKLMMAQSKRVLKKSPRAGDAREGRTRCNENNRERGRDAGDVGDDRGLRAPMPIERNLGDEHCSSKPGLRATRAGRAGGRCRGRSARSRPDPYPNASGVVDAITARHTVEFCAVAAAAVVRWASEFYETAP